MADERATLGNILVDVLLIEPDLHDAIFFQGIDSCDDIGKMDEDDLKTAFYFICRPGGQIPIPNHVVGDADHPALMKNPGNLAPTLHEEHVKLLLYFYRHLDCTSRLNTQAANAPTLVRLNVMKNLKSSKKADANTKPTVP